MALRTVSDATKNDDDDDCIGSTLGKLSRVLSRIHEIETLNKNFSEFFNMRKFLEIFALRLSLLVRILESTNFT